LLCGKEFEKKSNNQKYCSLECLRKAGYEKQKQKRRIISDHAICAVCGAEFKRKGKEKVCSDVCRNVVLKRTEKVCKVCGKHFIATRQNIKFCSDECRAKNKKAAHEWQKAEEKKPEKKILSISAIAKKARKLGLSYGKYIEAIENGAI
jgi:predicted nucleic acid-binding Zn ribbon protein